jgi:hypothetical protein
VAENHGLLNYKVTDAPFNPVVHIRTADTGPSWSDDDIVWRGEFGNWSVFVGELVLGLEDERRVLKIC